MRSADDGELVSSFAKAAEHARPAGTAKNPPNPATDEDTYRFG
jgi:hypothetical protein